MTDSRLERFEGRLGYAVFSPDPYNYRYLLNRQIDPLAPTETLVTFVLLNPSTADQDHNDPTIRRCIGYARSWGYSKLDIVNVNPFRSTDPKHMIAHELPGLIADVNAAAVMGSALSASLVVVAWGATPLERVPGAIRAVDCLMDTLVPTRCLQRTKDGHPRHPLYTRKSIEVADLEPWW